MEADDKKLIPLARLAHVCGISVAHLAKMARSGRLPATQAGRIWLTTPEALKAFLSAHSGAGRPTIAGRRSASLNRELRVKKLQEWVDAPIERQEELEEREAVPSVPEIVISPVKVGKCYKSLNILFCDCGEWFNSNFGVFDKCFKCRQT